MPLTDCPDDGRSPIHPLWFIFGVEAGRPFDFSPVGQMVKRVTHDGRLCLLLLEVVLLWVVSIRGCGWMSGVVGRTLELCALGGTKREEYEQLQHKELVRAVQNTPVSDIELVQEHSEST